MKALENIAGKQIGDPERAAAAIIEAVSSPEPPFHLVLGSDALKRTLDKQTRFSAELEKWKEVSLSTDF